MFSPVEEVRQAVVKVSYNHPALKENWLNDAVKIYLPAPDPSDPQEIQSYDGEAISVASASAEYVLAMKLRAGRRGRDEKDIDLLCELCNITSTDEAISLFERFYPDDQIKRSSIEILDMILGPPRRSYR